MFNQIEDILDFVKQKPLELKEISFSEIENSTINNLEIPERFKINLTNKDNKIWINVKGQIIFDLKDKLNPTYSIKLNAI